MQTDYKNLNDRIVKQAYEVSNLVLTNDMKVRLFQNKIDRARIELEARKLSPAFYTDSF
jgi:hypothetical protein